MKLPPTPGIAAVLAKINRLDLEPIAFKLAHPEPNEIGMPVPEVQKAVALYRDFLKLVAMYPGRSIVPTKLIDKVWHTHILDTAKYAADCQEVFGYFVHHFPYFGLRGAEDAENLKKAGAETRELFVHHFGVELTQGAAECEPSCTDGQPGGCDYSINMQGRERPRLALA